MKYRLLLLLATSASFAQFETQLLNETLGISHLSDIETEEFKKAKAILSHCTECHEPFTEKTGIAFRESMKDVYRVMDLKNKGDDRMPSMPPMDNQWQPDEKTEVPLLRRWIRNGAIKYKSQKRSQQDIF